MARIPTRNETPDLVPGRRSCEVASTAAKAISYDQRHQALYVTWAGGGEYQYSGVSPTIFQALCAAPSKGKFLNRVIVGRTGGRAKALGSSAYPYRKIG